MTEAATRGKGTVRIERVKTQWRGDTGEFHIYDLDEQMREGRYSTGGAAFAWWSDPSRTESDLSAALSREALTAIFEGADPKAVEAELGRVEGYVGTNYGIAF